jgi:hypothetical protein
MENSGIIRTATYSDIWVDEFGNIRHSTDFELVLGKINKEFRFVPQGVSIEQGLTTEMLDIISELIRKRAGIGEKKAEPLKEE